MKNLFFIIFSTLVITACSTKKIIESNERLPEVTMENTTSMVNTVGGVVLIPGVWQPFHYDKSSGQHFMTNLDSVTVAIANNPKKSYPFYKSGQSDFETIEVFTAWDIDFQIENKVKAMIIKKSPENEFIIWKFKDNLQIENVFLYGKSEENILNLMVSSSKWSEVEKIAFLEALYFKNKK